MSIGLYEPRRSGTLCVVNMKCQRRLHADNNPAGRFEDMQGQNIV